MSEQCEQYVACGSQGIQWSMVKHALISLPAMQCPTIISHCHSQGHKGLEVLTPPLALAYTATHVQNQ